MKTNFNSNILFNGRMLCKGQMCGLRKKPLKNEFSANESKKLIGTSDFADEIPNRLSARRTFEVDTGKISGIDMDAIHFVSDDNNIYAQLLYQPKGATETEKKLNYIVALNAYNTAHQHDVDTKIDL